MMFLALNPDDHLWASPKQKLEEHKVGDIEQVCEEEEEDSTADLWTSGEPQA